jgi:hypothetical protein
MQNINNKISLFKKIDLGLFENIDKFKKTPNYNTLQDFYNSLDEEQQKALKASIIFAFILCFFNKFRLFSFLMRIKIIILENK